MPVTLHAFLTRAVLKELSEKLCLMFAYTCTFWVWVDFADLRKGLHIMYNRSLITPRWSCAVHRTFKSKYHQLANIWVSRDLSLCRISQSQAYMYNLSRLLFHKVIYKIKLYCKIWGFILWNVGWTCVALSLWILLCVFIGTIQANQTAYSCSLKIMWKLRKMLKLVSSLIVLPWLCAFAFCCAVKKRATSHVSFQWISLSLLLSL